MDYFDYNVTPAFENHSQLQDFDIERFLERSQERERQRIEQELKRIEEELEHRDRIHDEAITELESKLDWYVDRLDTLYKQHRGKQGKRDRLRNQIQQFYQEIREETRSLWRDRQELERERRDVLRELEEMSDEILNELL